MIFAVHYANLGFAEVICRGGISLIMYGIQLHSEAQSVQKTLHSVCQLLHVALLRRPSSGGIAHDIPVSAHGPVDWQRNAESDGVYSSCCHSGLAVKTLRADALSRSHYCRFVEMDRSCSRFVYPDAPGAEPDHFLERPLHFPFVDVGNRDHHARMGAERRGDDRSDSRRKFLVDTHIGRSYCRSHYRNR